MSTRPARGMSARTEAALLVAVPLALFACAALGVQHSALVTALVALACLALWLFGFDRSRPALGQLMPVIVLGALAVAGRVLFAPLPYVKPVSAICILAGAVYGKRCGFMVGALAALVSNLFFGQGPWTPWQMYSWGLVGYFAGVLAAHGAFERSSAVLAYGFASGLLFGFIMNSWYVVGFVQPLTWQGALVAYGAGLAFDLTHGIATAAFLALIYVPLRAKLVRIRTKYGLLRA